MLVWFFFYLLTSLIFFFLILNEFKNTANLKQPSRHVIVRTFEERVLGMTITLRIRRVARYWPNFIYLKSELQSIHTVIFTDMIKLFCFFTCGNNVGDPEGTHKTLYCRFILNKVVQFGCNTC